MDRNIRPLELRSRLMASLVLRSIFFALLQPGVAVLVIPVALMQLVGQPLTPDLWAWNHYAGIASVIAGFVIAGVCIVRFTTEGKGTLSPLDPTKRLVISGLYKYSRNPMYVGMMLVLIGETVFWWSTAMAVYSVLMFVVFNLFIFLHEEPRLRREFPREYDAYIAQVRRWV